MFNLDSDKVKNFLDYMLFFEYAKYLKDSAIIKRGLLSPDIEDESNIRKRISSVLLKGLRSDLGFNIGTTITNEKEYCTCDKITRVRSRSNNSTESYFSFTNLYSGKKFISGDYFDINNVYTISNITHKEGLIRAMSLGADEAKIQSVIDKYELVFFQTPNWWGLKQVVQDSITRVSADIEVSIAAAISNNEFELPNDANRHIPIRNVSVEIAQANTNHRYRMHYFKDVAGDTIRALYDKYVKLNDIRIPSPNYDVNPNYTANPVFDNLILDGLIANNRNQIISGLGNMVMDGGDYSLALCRKFEDDDGLYLAPNLFDIEITVQWRASKAILNKPELLFRYIKEFDNNIKDFLIGRNNE